MLTTIIERRTFFFFFFSHFTFQLLDKPWSQVSSLLPPGACLQFLSRLLTGFSNPAARRFFISSVANSRSRAFRKSTCAQEKAPTNLHEYALGGARTHETDLYQLTRLEDNLICHRGDRQYDFPYYSLLVLHRVSTNHSNIRV